MAAELPVTFGLQSIQTRCGGFIFIYREDNAMTDKRLRLIKMLDDRALEMHGSNATHCVFTRDEVALMLDGARGLKVQMDNALSSCEAARNDLIAAQGFCDKLRGDLKAVTGERDNLRSYLSAAGATSDAWKRRCDEHRVAYRELKALADGQTAQLHEAKQTETELKKERDDARQRAWQQVVTINQLRNENSDLHNCVKTLSLRPAQYSAGGAASGCSNSIDAAKAQQSPLQQLCRDRLRQTITDGTWTQFPELRQYVAEIAINGEPNQ